MRAGSGNKKGKEIVRLGSGNKKGKGIVRAGSGKKAGFLMLPHPLATFEIQKYNQIKDWADVTNVDEYGDVDTHWIALFCNRSYIVYFDSFGVFIGNKNIKASIFRVQPNNSVMCGNFCTGFIGFMIAGENLTDFTSIFSPYDFEESDFLSYFKDG